MAVAFTYFKIEYGDDAASLKKSPKKPCMTSYQMTPLSARSISVTVPLIDQFSFTYFSVVIVGCFFYRYDVLTVNSGSLAASFYGSQEADPRTASNGHFSTAMNINNI